MTNSLDDVDVRIAGAIVRALGPGAAAGPRLRMGETPGWDSMGHMVVVMEVEREFGIQFPTYRLPQLTDAPSIGRVIREMLAP